MFFGTGEESGHFRGHKMCFHRQAAIFPEEKIIFLLEKIKFALGKIKFLQHPI